VNRKRRRRRPGMASSNGGVTVGKSLVIKGYITGIISLRSNLSTISYSAIIMIVEIQPTKY